MQCVLHCQVVVEVQGKQIQLQVLAVLEFNSDRKRMSILCRLPDGRSALEAIQCIATEALQCVCNRGRTYFCNRGHTVYCNRGHTIYCNKGHTVCCTRGHTVCYNRGHTVCCNRGRTLYCNRGRTVYCNRGHKVYCNQGGTVYCNRGHTVYCNHGRTVYCNRGHAVYCNRGHTLNCTSAFRNLNNNQNLIPCTLALSACSWHHYCELRLAVYNVSKSRKCMRLSAAQSLASQEGHMMQGLTGLVWCWYAGCGCTARGQTA